MSCRLSSSSLIVKHLIIHFKWGGKDDVASTESWYLQIFYYSVSELSYSWPLLTDYSFNDHLKLQWCWRRLTTSIQTCCRCSISAFTWLCLGHMATGAHLQQCLIATWAPVATFGEVKTVEKLAGRVKVQLQDVTLNKPRDSLNDCASSQQSCWSNYGQMRTICPWNFTWDPGWSDCCGGGGCCCCCCCCCFRDRWLSGLPLAVAVLPR